MRKLKTSDLFKLSKIVKKMDVKEDVKSLAVDVTGKSDEEKLKINQDLQVDLLFLFMERLGNAEQDIYSFLADLCFVTENEIKDMDLDEFIGLVKELFAQESLGQLFTMALA